MSSTLDETLFRFVGMRDAQRRQVRAGALSVLQAPAFDEDAPTALHQALRGAADRNGVEALVEQFIASEDFISSMSEAPSVIQKIENLLLPVSDQLEASKLIKAAVEELRSGDDDNRTLSKLLADPETRQERNRCADSFLAAALAETPPERSRADLARIVLLWGLLRELTRHRQANANDVASVLLNGVVVFPADLTGSPFEIGYENGQPASYAPRVRTSLEAHAEVDESAELQERAQRLDAAASDLVVALASPEPTKVTAIEGEEARGFIEAASGNGNAALEDPWVLNGSLRHALTEETIDVLTDEGLDRPGATVPALVSELTARAADAFSASVATAHPLTLPEAVLAELRRMRGPLAAFPSPETLEADGALEKPAAQLTRPPIIGDLKVVRQTLRAYERGEIAHVENVLIGEFKERLHQIVDTREEEVIELEEKEEERSFDTQTTERNEMETETKRTIDSDEEFTAGVNVSASYGSFVQVEASVGYASSTSKSQSDRNSALYARDVTERAASSIRTRTEETRRRLTRREITEKNTHILSNLGGEEHVVGIYRWIDKVYDVQVYNYGLRVLLDIGLPDPSASYRYAAALDASISVDVDPPPALTLTGKPSGKGLSPSLIKSSNWQTLANIFRVANMPPPPAALVTVSLPLSADKPAAKPQEGTGQQASTQESEPPNRLFKTSRELNVPAGYIPMRFVACAICDGAVFKVPPLSPTDRATIQTAINTYSGAYPDAAAAATKWLAWDPESGEIPALTEAQRNEFAGLLNTPAILVVSANAVASARAFLDAATPGRPRPGVDLAVGPVLVHADPGPRKVTGVFNASASGTPQPPEIVTGDGQTSVLALAAATGGGEGFAATITVLCGASQQLVDAWQMKAFEAVVLAQQAWESDFRAAVASASAARGVAIEGRNPGDNREIIQSELKRSAIEMFGGVDRAELDASTPGNPDSTPPIEPQLDRNAAGRAARLVQFYEQSFEWAQMAYLFYPYFWSGHDDWPEASLRSNVDPLFAQFLRAGSARVVLPIRPGFEGVVASRLGLKLPVPWPSSPPPVMPADPYLDIAEEIRAAQDTATGGVATGPSWSLRLPTTLVVLDGPELPRFDENGG